MGVLARNGLILSCMICCICDVLHDLVPFAQLKKREKHPWRSITFSKVAGFSNMTGF